MMRPSLRLLPGLLPACVLIAAAAAPAQFTSPDAARTPSLARRPGQPEPTPPPAQASQATSPGESDVLPEVDSILRHRAWHTEFMDPRSPAAGGSPSPGFAGYRNPDGVGRENEYYRPGNQFQNPAPKHITAKIGLGGVPDRAEQLAAFNAGTARYSALQSHIDRYGRPMMGFGMGFGFGGFGR